MTSLHRYRLFKVFAGIVLIVGALVFVRIKRYNPPPGQPIPTLPRFETTDIKGQTIDSRDLAGKKTYVQFIRSRDSDDLTFLNEFLADWKDEAIRIFLVAEESSMQLMKLVPGAPKDVILCEKYDNLSGLFNVASGGSRYLFGETGTTLLSVRTGISYASARREFNRLLKGKSFRISQLVRIGDNVRTHAEFVQIWDYLQNNKKDLCVVGFFTSICEGCSSGNLVAYLNGLYQKNRERLDVLGILGGKFVQNDIAALRSQLKIDFSLQPAEPPFSAQWAELVHQYSESELTCILFVVTRDGTITKVFWAGCRDCWDDFRSYLKSKIEKQ